MPIRKSIPVVGASLKRCISFRFGSLRFTPKTLIIFSGCISLHPGFYPFIRRMHFSQSFRKRMHPVCNVMHKRMHFSQSLRRRMHPVCNDTGVRVKKERFLTTSPRFINSKYPYLCINVRHFVFLISIMMIPFYVCVCFPQFGIRVFCPAISFD